MAMRNRLARQKKEVKETPKHLTWESIPKTEGYTQPPVSPFGGLAVSKKSVPLSITLWASAIGINPDVFQDTELNTLINEKDEYAWNRLVWFLNDPKFFPNHANWGKFCIDEESFKAEFLYHINHLD